MMRTFRVEVERSDRWWILTVPDVPSGFSQARALLDVPDTARDLISLILEIPADSFDLDVDLRLPDAVREHLDRSASLREEAAHAQSEAATEVRTAARMLHHEGVPLRDIGRALGVSYQRAHQLVSS